MFIYVKTGSSTKTSMWSSRKLKKMINKEITEVFGDKPCYSLVQDLAKASFFDWSFLCGPNQMANKAIIRWIYRWKFRFQIIETSKYNLQVKV